MVTLEVLVGVTNGIIMEAGGGDPYDIIWQPMLNQIKINFFSVEGLKERNAALDL